MSLVAGGISLVLAVAFAGFTVDLSRASTARARAQTAADSAALAAVAESSPYGEGLPAIAADEFARANGAELLECLCEPGATAVQVRVAVDGVVAEARAVFDPAAVAPAPEAAAGRGLHPQMAAAVGRLLGAAGGRVLVVSGYRSSARQRELWARALATHGSPEAADDWVAPPGSSLHEQGLAVDLSGDLGLAAKLVDDLGLPLHRPLPNEPWHFELLGART